MTRHDWQEYAEQEAKTSADITSIKKFYKCKRCHEKSIALKHHYRKKLSQKLYGDIIEYSKNWDGDCDLSIVRQIYEL